MRIGLTGGIGSGKSEVAKTFEALGAYVIDTDALAREAVEPGSDAFLEIARAWPTVVRGGALDRAALSEIVFADPDARQRLNGILHPHIRRLAIERERLARPGQPIVHVVPLLFETDYSSLVDRTVVVLSPEENRIARVRARDGIAASHIRARMAVQIDPEVARARADYAIENDGDLAHLRERATRVYCALTGGG